ncbi:hypothetical protein [Nocardia sp. NPDC057030]|uniref:hypothetical protein n=1 Tax=unclassified Nocardia TaxID=2637762 RepID=UPI0036393E12
MATNYALAPVGFDRYGNLLNLAVTDNADTYGYVVATTAGEALSFLRGTGPGPATRSCGDGHEPSRAYRTVGYHYTGEDYRRVRPMFWTIREGGVVHEVWSVARKVLVFGRGTTVNRPDWAALRRAEIDARHETSTPAETSASAVRKPDTTQGVEMITVTAAQLADTARVGDAITLRDRNGTVRSGEFVAATEITVGPRQMIRVELETRTDFLTYYQELDGEISVGE